MGTDVKIAVFRTDGGVVQANITSGFAQQGSYSLILWKADENKPVSGYPKLGNFINTDDDRYDLPRPNRVNDGRLVESLVTVALARPVKKYAVALEILQDNKVIGSDTADGESDEPTVTLDLFVQLKAS